MDNVREILALYQIQGLGYVSILKIMQHFKSLNELLDSNETKTDELISKKHLIQIKKNIIELDKFAQKQLEQAEKLGVRIISYYDKEYPNLLKEIYDAPPLLFIKGNFSILNDKTLAIVGTRLASDYGLKTAGYFAGGLAENGVTVVSGMARGIDSAAHKSAIEAGGSTIAVVGCGLDIVYPPENKNLKSRIEEHGVMVSELPFGTEPLAHNFPRRNRIISGLSYGTIVIEAGMKSGALITAQTSIDQGREVFAVPGSIYNKRTKGTHYLIRQGAVLVEDVSQVFIEIPGWVQSKQSFTEEEIRGSLSEKEKALWDVMNYEPMHIDSITETTGTNISNALTVLLSMELKGYVKQLSGMMFIKV